MLEGIHNINKNMAVNADAIYTAIPQVAIDRCLEMDDLAQAATNKYSRALLLFSKCHNPYNSSTTFQDSDLSTLRK